MKYVVILNDAYETECDYFDTEEEALEFINNPYYKKYTATVFKGEELQVLKIDGKKILSSSVVDK